MRRIALSFPLYLFPVLVAAQAPDSAPASTQAKAKMSAEAAARVDNLPPGLSAETRTRIETIVEAAHQKHLPGQPIADRAAEAKAKGATEAQMVSECGKTMAQLEASQTALIRAGRTHPDSGEVTRGAQVIARGATAAQLEAFARKAPSDRGLEVAFEVLTQLVARGVPVDRALAVVGGRLSGGASDGQLVSVLASGSAGLGAGVSSGTGTNGGVTAGGSVTGAVGAGIVRKP